MTAGAPEVGLLLLTKVLFLTWAGLSVREPRLHQLIRQRGPIEDRTFEIEFLDPGVHALDFTFG